MSICLLYFAIPQFTGHSLVCLPHLGLRPVRLDNLRDRPFQFGIYAKSTSKGGARVLKEFFKAALFYAKNLMSWQYAGLNYILPFRRGGYHPPAP